jgi:hypothetical protein
MISKPLLFTAMLAVLVLPIVTVAAAAVRVRLPPTVALPLKFTLLPVAAPMFGVTSVGVLANT